MLSQNRQILDWGLRHALAACLVCTVCVFMALGAAGQAPSPAGTATAPAASSGEKAAAATPHKTPKKAEPKSHRTVAASPQVQVAAPRTNIATPTKSPSQRPPIAMALRIKADFDFNEVPLADVVESLKKLTKLDVQLDRRVLEDVNVTTDTPITFSAKNISVRDALKLMLRNMQPELTCITKDNVLLITTPDIASEELETRVYAVQDLIAPRPSYPFEGMYVPGVSHGGFPKTLPAGASGAGPMGMGGGMGGTGGGMGGTGGGMFGVPDKSSANKPSSATGASVGRPQILAQVAQPEKRGKRTEAAAAQPGGGMAAGRPRDTGLSFTMDDLIDTITGCIKPTSWADVGAPGSISPMGGMLVISQTEEIHQEIEKFLDNLRASSPGLKTVSVRATWLLLNLKQLDEISRGGSGRIDRKALDEMAAKAKGYVGAVTCLSGQTVHIASGRNHSAVVGAVPVVGGGGEGENVGYQPIMSNPQSGAMLQVTPHLLPNMNAVLLDLCTSVTRAEVSAEPIHFLGGEKGEAKKDSGVSRNPGGRTTMNLDRVNLVVGQLATTLRVPLDQPTLVGGLTREPAADEQEAADTPQLYLFIEAAVR
jgi:hypothetical protein